MDIGVVHYTIGAGGGTLDALWHSTRFPADRPGTGIARGDTSNGFPGRYEITYFLPNGDVSAVLDLVIERSGAVYTLTYSKDGETLLTGIGFETADGLSAGYRKLGEA